MDDTLFKADSPLNFCNNFLFFFHMCLENQIQLMQPEIDLLIVLFLHRFHWLEGMIGPKRCLTTKLHEYHQRLHAEPNQIFEGLYLIRPKENCIAKSRPLWEHHSKNAKYQEHMSTYAELSKSSSNFLTRLSKQEETKPSDPIAAPKLSIPSTQFLLIKVSTFVMLSIDHSSHSFLCFKPNFSPDSERILTL